MEKYQTYSKYKDFKTVFLNTIPSHWDVKPLYTICGFRQGKAHEPFVDDDGKYICVNSRFVSTRGQKIKRCTQNLTPANLYDVLMVMSDLPNGRALAKAFYVENNNMYAVNQRVCALTAHKINSKFLYYQLDRSPYFLMYDDGSNQTHLSNDSYRKYPVLVPLEEEQKQIANFLDHETAKIDQLIEKQQQLIKLLKEKRQAVISHAVTKGLNPNAPMKDSGVEWLGDVPEHWDVSKLKYLTIQIVDGAHFTPTYVDEGVPFLRVTDIHSEKINMDHIKYIPRIEHQDLIKRCNPQKGDLLLSKNGTIGVPKIVDWDWEFSIFVSLCLIKFNKKLNVNYAYYFFKTHEIREQIFGQIKQSTVINLHLDKIAKFDFTVPPIKEQKEIVNHLDQVISKYDLQLNKANQISVLLRERRTALISAAVTGKIDVRNWKISQ
ncbi:restriction modification system DNA specificity domain-containing protein [Marinicella pacifica]|uniref:Restriction modification system DNA specificity domain-containing protein n=1 Tax=Marinicella pacifica TaxID=1171543 RepID=A0A917CQI2_9GAMM|nr:restriction endonuclease subunit S [Marinicella pacifica]GGF96157.1 restriction modification system DNA specificity domain-containing protein [Marinicella pacifica]